MPADHVTIGQAKELRSLNRKYPRQLVRVMGETGSIAGLELNHARKEVWRSRDFLVQVIEEPNGIVRLSINRTEFNVRLQRWRDGITWDEVQRLKREAGYGDRCAVELYPPDAKLVDVANVRHVWVLPEPPSFMWGKG